MFQRKENYFRRSVFGRMMFICAVVLAAFFFCISCISAADDTFIMRVITPDNKVITLDVRWSYSVEQVKDLIYQQTGIPTDLQQLYLLYGAVILESTSLLFQYSIYLFDNAFVKLTVVPPSYPPDPEPTAVPVFEEPVFYPLPEDEIGAYAISKDGTKEYLLFHTYDICMEWLSSDELCSGYERCFHKDGK